MFCQLRNADKLYRKELKAGNQLDHMPRIWNQVHKLLRNLPWTPRPSKQTDSFHGTVGDLPAEFMRRRAHSADVIIGFLCGTAHKILLSRMTLEDFLALVESVREEMMALFTEMLDRDEVPGERAKELRRRKSCPNLVSAW